jgi:hypothetical protein
VEEKVSLRVDQHPLLTLFLDVEKTSGLKAETFSAIG